MGSTHHVAAWRGEAVANGGFVRALDPRTRVAAAFMFSLAVVSLNGLPALLLALLLSLALVFAARLPPVRSLRQVVAVDGFILITVILLPFTLPGEEIFRLGDFPASREGLLRALEIAIKANAVVLSLMALVGTLDASVLGRALKHFRLPDGLVHLLLFTVRYIEVLQREFARLRLAMRARAFCARGDMHTWRSFGYLIGMVLVRSFERSERILAAMKCRGFDGRLHLPRDMTMTGQDARFAALGVCFIVVLLGLETL